ncbi:hypothetical protein RI367_008381 [Sorochytrium milnesiophthora]
MLQQSQRAIVTPTQVLDYLHSTQGLPVNSQYATQMAWVVAHDPSFQYIFNQVARGGPSTFHQVMMQPPVSNMVPQTYTECIEAERSPKCWLAKSALINALRNRQQASTEYGFSGDYGGYDYATPYQQYSADNDFSLDGQNDYSWDSIVHSVNRGMDKFVDATSGWTKILNGPQKPAPPPSPPPPTFYDRYFEEERIRQDEGRATWQAQQKLGIKPKEYPMPQKDRLVCYRNHCVKEHVW